MNLSGFPVHVALGVGCIWLLGSLVKSIVLWVEAVHFKVRKKGGWVKSMPLLNAFGWSMIFSVLVSALDACWVASSLSAVQEGRVGQVSRS